MSNFKNGFEDVAVVENLMAWLNYLKYNRKNIFERAKVYADNLDH